MAPVWLHRIKTDGGRSESMRGLSTATFASAARAPLFGLMVRLSAGPGVLLMLVYWMAHMDWPFIENKNNFLVDQHLAYAGVLVLLVVKQADHVWGLDALADKLDFFQGHPKLRVAFA
jgi:hypothetical protein